MNIRQQITSATSGIPKPINPTVHAVLDYATSAYFFGVAAGLWRRNRAGAIGALVNGGAVLGLSLMTDYPGGVWTLPPTQGQAEVDRWKYLAIGESDRLQPEIPAQFWMGILSFQSRTKV